METIPRGHGVNARNGPFAAGAFGGLVLAVATYSHVSGKKLNGGWLRAVTKASAVLGFANLAAGLGARLLSHEDERMAWIAAEVVAALAPGSTPPGRIYPAMVSLELLLEFVGAILPSGVVALAHALVMYTGPAAVSKSK